MILTIITWIAFLTFAIQLGFWIFIFSKIGFLSPIQPILTHFKGVSVIICVKNEEENISRLIQLILGQNYPELPIKIQRLEFLKILKQVKNQELFME